MQEHMLKWSIRPKMNVENASTGPLTELTLAPNYSNYSVHHTANSSNSTAGEGKGEGAGAGANAVSTVDVTYAPSDPLSELVWCSQRGLSVKCTDCSYGNNKPVLFWGIGPSDAVHSPIILPNTTPGRFSCEKTIDHGKNVTFPTVSTSSRKDEDKSLAGDHGQLKLAFQNPVVKGGDVSTSYVRSKLDWKSITPPPPPAIRLEESASSWEKDIENMVKTTNPPNVGKLESTSENDIRGHEDERSRFCRQIHSQHTPLGHQHSPTRNRVRRDTRKGKENALSVGDVNTTKDDNDIDIDNNNNDSHESAESCNSTGLFPFPTGKRKLNFEQHLSAESERVKKRKIREKPGSQSCMKQDSSFVNWISNMVKGFTKSKEEDDPSLTLTLRHSNNDHACPEQNLNTCSKNQDRGSKDVGFQSMFQSIYYPKVTVQDKTALDVINQTENRLPETGVDGNVTCNEDNTTTFGGKQLLEENTTTLVDVQPKRLSLNIGCVTRNNKTYDRCNVSTNMEKGLKRRVGDLYHEPSLEKKATQNVGYSNDPLGSSLWVTRLAQNKIGSSSNLDHCNVSTGRVLDCMDLVPCSLNQVSSSKCIENVQSRQKYTNDPPASMDKESEKIPTEPEASIDQKQISKIRRGFYSPRFKNAEAISSLFSSRLNALKSIMQSDSGGGGGGGGSSASIVICYFCGKKGHFLQDCSEITDSDLEDILRNTYNGKEEPSRFCIRCFQFNHWPISCPKATSKRHSQAVATDKTMLGKNIITMYAASRSNANTSKENQLGKLCTSDNKQFLDFPKEIFDAVKMLRLSRKKLLDWMSSSKMSLSHLDGFFLRLRLGNWEGGGTGYYVASITAPKQRSPRNARRLVSVNVGGVKCLVESQYISNQDFLEDELTAWWSATAKSGGKLPSREDLKLKLKELSMLGL